MAFVAILFLPCVNISKITMVPIIQVGPTPQARHQRHGGWGHHPRSTNDNIKSYSNEMPQASAHSWLCFLFAVIFKTNSSISHNGTDGIFGKVLHLHRSTSTLGWILTWRMHDMCCRTRKDPKAISKHHWLPPTSTRIYVPQPLPLPFGHWPLLVAPVRSLRGKPWLPSQHLGGWLSHLVIWQNTSGGGHTHIALAM